MTPTAQPAAPKRGIPEDAAGLVFFRSIQGRFEYLYDRWRDEQEYEDFSEYQAAAKTWCDGKVDFVKLTKTPFQLSFKSDGHTYAAKVTSRNVSITRVKS